MGTRGLLGHILRSKNLRKAVYNHFDSYPSCLGRNVAKFISKLSDKQIQQMTELIGKIEWVSERSQVPAELQDRYSAMGFANTEVSSGSTADWHCLLHKVQGAAALPHILDGSLVHLVDATAFEKDELFCEWSYFVDWEERVVHVTSNAMDGKQASFSFEEFTEDRMVGLQDEWNKEDEDEFEGMIGEAKVEGDVKTDDGEQQGGEKNE